MLWDLVVFVGVCDFFSVFLVVCGVWVVWMLRWCVLVLFGVVGWGCWWWVCWGCYLGVCVCVVFCRGRGGFVVFGLVVLVFCV